MPLTSFYTALTGLNNNSTSINVIGDNLANINTTAYKAGKANFAEVLAGLSGSSANGNPVVFGLGSALNGITHTNTQGTLSYTGKSTDAAINGNGFFMVESEGGYGYCRSGKLEMDKYGNLYNSDGLKILGYMAQDGVIDSNSPLVPLRITKAQVIPGTATSQINIPGNLDAGSTTTTTSIQIYDSLGVSHTITLQFDKSVTNWNWSALMPAEDLGGLATDPPVQVGSGTLGFDGTGRLSSPATNPTFNISGLASGANSMDIAIGVWDDNGLATITNYANGSSNFVPSQNGSSASILKDIKIESSGKILGVSEGGSSIALAQLAIADFPNIEGLQKFKGSTFVAFPSAGEPSIGVAGTGGRGTVVGESLEQSNVDMAQEFVNLIVAQRAYLANSKIITTSDELYQDSLNLKR
jgi:flagellar hook protein FlgE